jgi:hypothetical protein
MLSPAQMVLQVVSPLLALYAGRTRFVASRGASEFAPIQFGEIAPERASRARWGGTCAMAESSE